MLLHIFLSRVEGEAFSSLYNTELQVQKVFIYRVVVFTLRVSSSGDMSCWSDCKEQKQRLTEQ